MILCDSQYMAKTKEERQSHLDLSEPCILRGADSIQCRGLLAHFLDTSIPNDRQTVLAHACHNCDCNNPKHLYWGTRSENAFDMVSSPQWQSILDKKRANLRGEKNHNFGKKPWTVQNAHQQSWAKAQFIYSEYFAKGWDFSKYGQGLTYFITKYGVAQGSGKAMLKMFKTGWVPEKDPDWVTFFGNK